MEQERTGASMPRRTYPLHTVDDQGALAGLAAAGARECAVLQGSDRGIGQVGTVAYVLVDGGRAEAQGLLQAIGTRAGRNLGALDEHKVHGYGARHRLRFVGSRLQLQQLRGGGPHGQLVDANQAEAKELGRIRCNHRMIVDLKEYFSRLWGEFAERDEWKKHQQIGLDT